LEEVCKYLINKTKGSMFEDFLSKLLANGIFMGPLIWIGLNQIKRIDKHDEQIQKILELMAETNSNITKLLERTKHL
jgi:hypothetical protein